MTVSLSITVKDDDRRWNELRKGLRAMGGAEVKAGLVGEKAAALHKGATITVADVGLIHEFGSDKIPERSFIRASFDSGKIPERSFIRASFDANLEKYDRLLTNLERAVYAGRAGVKGALDLLGSTMASDMKARIRAGIAPALAARTVARKIAKNRIDPTLALVDTRQLINALEHTTTFGGDVAASAAAKAA